MKNRKIKRGRKIIIMIEDDSNKKIRIYQSKVMQKKNNTYSYSKAVNDLLRKAF